MSTSEHYYGPTTIGAIQEFLRLGDINAETFLINTCDETRRQIREMPPLFKTASPMAGRDANDAASKSSAEPAAVGISVRLQERIRDLEQMLNEERRALNELEQRYQELEQKYNKLLGQAQPVG